MKTFTAGQELSTHSTCDCDCVFTGTVINRTAKTVTIKTAMKGIARYKIYTDEEGEFLFPFGRHSMSPVFRA